MSTKDTVIPPGWVEDSKGRLLPESCIQPIDLERDKLIAEIVTRAKSVNAALREFRSRTFADIAAFADLSAEKWKVSLGGKKGNISLVSFSGKYKVLRAMSDVLVFDERLQAAKVLIDECLTRWAENSGEEIKALVQDAFQVDQAGNINTARVLGLRRYNFEDEGWKSAMQAINESLNIFTTKSYIRVYERDSETGAYHQINLDLANA